MIVSLAQRRLEGELMDDPAVDADAHVAALRGLRRINRVSRTAATLWPSIARIAQVHRGGTLSLLDVATGGGDVPVRRCAFSAWTCSPSRSRSVTTSLPSACSCIT